MAHTAKMKSEISVKQTDSFYSILFGLRDVLREGGDRLVLAESCTSGLIASELGRIPGISEFFCGSMVVYRTQTKSDWLGISSNILEDSAIGPVSEQTTIALARTILERTPDATVAAAITGHLGPGATLEMDGQIFCALESRGKQKTTKLFQAFKLSSPSVLGLDDLVGRSVRQREAAGMMLNFIWKTLTSTR